MKEILKQIHDLNTLSSLVVCAIQFKGNRNQPQKSKDRLIQLIHQAALNEADLIVLPELALSQYLFRNESEARMYSERFKSEGSTHYELCQIAHQLGIWLIGGFIEAGAGGLFNSAFIANPNGEVARYRKRLLFESDEIWALDGEGSRSARFADENEHCKMDWIHYHQADPYPLFLINGWLCTVGICMDLNDDRFTNFCMQVNVDLIAFPTNWLDQGYDIRGYWVWRLEDTPTYLIAANTYGAEQEIVFRGESTILSIAPPMIYSDTTQMGDALIQATLSKHVRVL